MAITFFQYVDMRIKIDRPISIASRDKDIGNRVYEILKGIQEKDKWTEEVDKLIKDNNVKYERADDEEFKEYAKNANDIIARF